MHDTVEFEKRGIPAAVVITEAFSRAATFQFRSKGMEGHPYVELPHPVSNLTAEQIREVTLRQIEALARQLTA